MGKSAYGGTVGYIGLGDMGGGITTHLAEVGVALRVFDLDPAAVARVVEKGAVGATSLEDLAAGCDVIVICVDPAGAVTSVINGLSPFLRAGQTVIIQSSIPPALIVEMAETLAAKQVTLYDAPVSGSHDDRRNGTLAVLTGATAETVGAERDLLTSIGRPLYMGALAGGEVAKLVNNSVMQATRLAMIEAMELGRAFGLSEDDLRRAMAISSGASFVAENWSYFDVQVRTGMTAKLAVKQSEEILALGASKGVRLRITETAATHGREIDEARFEYLRQQDLPSTAA
jgi:3-hydroxyisobutyrate dehydrogenase-like beta-hydroxyacid dehydrogenase